MLFFSFASCLFPPFLPSFPLSFFLPSLLLFLIIPSVANIVSAIDYVLTIDYVSTFHSIFLLVINRLSIITNHILVITTVSFRIFFQYFRIFPVDVLRIKTKAWKVFLEMFVFTLILLFILKLKFPKRKSIVNYNTVSYVIVPKWCSYFRCFLTSRKSLIVLAQQISLIVMTICLTG